MMRQPCAPRLGQMPKDGTYRAECFECRWVGPWRETERMAALWADYADHVGLPKSAIREPEAHWTGPADGFIDALRRARLGMPTRKTKGDKEAP